MNKQILMITAAGLLAWDYQAHAAGDVRAAFGAGTYEVDTSEGKAESDLIGFDLRGSFKPTEKLFLRGEYLSTSGDKIEAGGEKFDIDTEIDVLRLGAGYGVNAGPVRVYGVLEYANVNVEIDGEGDDTNGWGVGGGIADQGSGPWLWNVELSWLSLDEVDGASLDATLGYRFTPALSGLIGVQSYVLEADGGDELTLSQFYLGGQFSF